MSAQTLPSLNVLNKAGRCPKHPHAGWDEHGCLACWFKAEGKKAQVDEWTRPGRLQHKRKDITQRGGKWAKVCMELHNGGKGYRMLLKMEGLQCVRRQAGKHLRRAATVYGFRMSAILTADGLSVMNVGPVNTNTRST